MQNPEKEFNDRVRCEFEAIDFPSDLVMTDFKRHLQFALQNESMATLQCDFPTLQKLHEHVRNGETTLDMQTMGTAINCIEKQTPISVSLGNGDYIEMLTNAVGMAQVWNGIAQPISNRIRREITAKANMGGQKIITPNNGILRSKR